MVKMQRHLLRSLLAAGSAGNASSIGPCQVLGVLCPLCPCCGSRAPCPSRDAMAYRAVSTSALQQCAPTLRASSSAEAEQAPSCHVPSGVSSGIPTSTAATATATHTSFSHHARVKRSLDVSSIPMFSLRSQPETPCSSGSSTTSSTTNATINQTSSSPSTSSSNTSPSTTSQKARPVDASPKHAELDWREMLTRARAAATQEDIQAARGETMLTDRFRRVHTYLRISLTERCNLRCQYCMPAEGVALTASSQLLTTPEIMRLARLFVEAGVTKVRLTGGEPTLRPDLPSLCSQLSALPGLQSLAMTSNGITLTRQLNELKAAGLNAINISLDTLRPERFEQLARRPGLTKVLRSIDTALKLGYRPVKVNCVVMRGVNDDEMADFVALTRDRPINVRFIEYMPFDGNVWSDRKMVPYKEMMARVQEALVHQHQHQHPPEQHSAAAPVETRPPMMALAGGGHVLMHGDGSSRVPPHVLADLPPAPVLHRLDDPNGEVAKNFQATGHVGTISFITSMTSHFCSDCNRLRLLADGSFKVCLFGANEVSLRDAMRGGATDEDLRFVIHAAVQRKKAAHAGMFELAKTANRPMITIGG